MWIRTQVVADAINADRVGIRISPGANIQGAVEPDEQDISATYTALLARLRRRHLAYVSMIHPAIESPLVQHLRHTSGSRMVANTGFSQVTDRQAATRIVEAEHADAVAVGRPAITNPDLITRWRHDRPETAPDPATFYQGGGNGYTDYPMDDAHDKDTPLG